jgi:hypothetical protein
VSMINTNRCTNSKYTDTTLLMENDEDIDSLTENDKHTDTTSQIEKDELKLKLIIWQKI